MTFEVGQLQYCWTVAVNGRVLDGSCKWQGTNRDRRIMVRPPQREGLYYREDAIQGGTLSV